MAVVPLQPRSSSRDKILLADDEDDLVVAIGETLIHEIGHYFGMDEGRIADLGYD